MTGLRTRLKDRRAHWLYRFECDGQVYTGGIGRFEDGRIAEVFTMARRSERLPRPTFRTRRLSRPWLSRTVARLRPSCTPWLGRVVPLVRWRRC
jgi:hypothetical protein